MLRCFLVTSTVPEKIIRLLIKFNINIIGDEEVVFMNLSLGISTITGNEHVDLQYTDYKDKSESELIKLKRPELVDILREYGHSLSGTKPDLVKRIKSGPKQSEISGSNLDEIVKAWFLKPLPRTDAFEQGSANESFVLKSFNII